MHTKIKTKSTNVNLVKTENPYTYMYWPVNMKRCFRITYSSLEVSSVSTIYQVKYNNQIISFKNTAVYMYAQSAFA